MPALRRVCVLLVLVALMWAAPAIAMPQAGSQDVVAQAQRLRDAGQFAAAAELLQRQLALDPGNGDLARLLAQTLYWLKDIDGARRTYDAALVRHPDDFTLRLQYARMLADTGAHAHARRLLTPLLANPATRADAESLLGLLAYWGGDLREAQRRFTTAVHLDPGQAEAAGHLRDIGIVTAPWVSASAGVWHDDQPLDRFTPGLEAGWFATPLTTLVARAQPVRYRADGRSTAGDGFDLSVSHVAAAARIETALTAGAIRRSFGDETWDWTGRASIGLRLPRQVTIRAQAERTPYFATTASLRTPIMVETVAAIVDWGDDVRGWLGEAALQRHAYPDGNTARTAYGWVLAPLVRRDDVSLQGGYGVSFSDATESRLTPAGRYDPYYTPDNLERHSLLAAVSLGGGRPATLRLDASVVVHASDDASPWRVRASLPVAIGARVTIEPRAEAGHTVFYSWRAASLHLTYRARRE